MGWARVSRGDRKTARWIFFRFTSKSADYFWSTRVSFAFTYKAHSKGGATRYEINLHTMRPGPRCFVHALVGASHDPGRDLCPSAINPSSIVHKPRYDRHPLVVILQPPPPSQKHYCFSEHWARDRRESLLLKSASSRAARRVKTTRAQRRRNRRPLRRPRGSPPPLPAARRSRARADGKMFPAKIRLPPGGWRNC